MKKIYLVDDSATILISMKSILKSNGYDVETAKDGDEALAKLKTGYKPDLMITDINMPKMNGIELLQAAKQLSHMRFTPVLVLTTETQQDRKAQARSAGAAGWLSKPVQQEQLIQVLKKLVP